MNATTIKQDPKESYDLVHYKAIADGFTAIQMAEANKKELAGSISNQKLNAYCLLIATFNTEKLTKKSAKAGAIRTYLENNGVTPASAKRYMEIGQEARKHFPQTNPSEMREAMRAKEIESESDLKKLCFGEKEKTIEEKIGEIAKKYLAVYKDEYTKEEIIKDFALACKQGLEEAYKEAEKKAVVKTVKQAKNPEPPPATTKH